MSLAHVKEALPKLVQQCPEGEIRHLLQLADDRLHGLEGKGPAVRVSKTDLLRALSEELPDEVERSTADHAAIALLNRERSRHERFDIRLAELSKHRMKRDAGGPSTLCKAVGVMLIISGFLLMAAGLFVAVSMMLSEERHQPAYIENTPGSCSGSYLVNQGGFLQPLWDAIARVQKQLS